MPLLYFFATIEVGIQSNQILTVIQRLSTEWIISLTVRFENLNPAISHCNIIHLTQGASLSQYGDRTPVIYLKPYRNKFYFGSAINGNMNYQYLTAQG